MAAKPGRISMSIEGMHCDGCVRRVRKLLEMAGASEVHAVAIGSAEFSLPEGAAPAEAVVEALKDAGFTATLKS